jgi:hypothetical protein
MATNLPTGLTYIAEPTSPSPRSGVRASCDGRAWWSARGADELINRARMPLYLRRAAATHFGWPS